MDVDFKSEQWLMQKLLVTAQIAPSQLEVIFVLFKNLVKDPGVCLVHELGTCYVGHVKDNKKNGKGLQIFLELTPITKEILGDSFFPCIVWFGDWVNGQFSGDQNYEFRPDEGIFKGQFRNGKKNGTIMTNYSEGFEQAETFKDNKLVSAKLLSKVNYKVLLVGLNFHAQNAALIAKHIEVFGQSLSYQTTYKRAEQIIIFFHDSDLQGDCGELNLLETDFYFGGFKSKKRNGKGTRYYSNGDIQQETYQDGDLISAQLVQPLEPKLELSPDPEVMKRVESILQLCLNNPEFNVYREGDWYWFTSMTENTSFCSIVSTKCDVYTGSISGFKKHGPGVLYSHSGDIEDQKYEQGKLIWSRKRNSSFFQEFLVVPARFREELIEKAEILYKNPQCQIRRFKRYISIGTFKPGFFKGILVAQWGEAHEGYINSKFLRSGKGKCYLSDGATFEGTFSSGMHNGEGILTTPGDGSKFNLRENSELVFELV